MLQFSEKCTNSVEINGVVFISTDCSTKRCRKPLFFAPPTKRENPDFVWKSGFCNFLLLFKVVPPVLISVSASFLIYLKKSCKCLTFKLGIWNFHFFFIYSNQSGTVKLFYLCFTPSSRRNPTKK